jgi:hypothetical protein
MLTRGKHVSMFGWRHTIWVVFAAPPGYQISHPIMLDATPRSFSPSAVRVIVGVAVYYRLTFFSFFSFLEKSRFVPPFFSLFQFQFLFFLFQFFSFLLIEVLFVFNLVLQFQFDIFYLFQLGPYCFDL